MPPPLYLPSAEPTSERGPSDGDLGIELPLDDDRSGLGPAPIANLAELPIDPATRVGVRASGPFFPLDEAIELRPEVRDAVLALSPDERVDRWARFRWIGLAAPAAWLMHVDDRWRSVRKGAEDLQKKLADAREVMEQLSPAERRVLEAKIPVLEKRMALNQLYVGVEGAFGLAAAVVIIAGARRLRALPVALGLGAFAFWLSTAGAAGVCFGAGSARAWIFALLGLIGAASLFGLAPSESSLTAALRARLGLPASPIAAPSARPQRRLDLVALLGASLVGLWLPASLDLLGKMRVSDSLRLLVFVGTCFVAFVGFLGFRPERAKTPPSLRAVLLAGALGFGTVTAADLAAQAGMLTVVETQQCFAPARAAKLEEVQKTAQKETTGARRQSQTQALAMLIALLAAPISEEMLYRGAFQRVARRALGGRWATLGSGLLFAVAHSFAFPTAWYNHVALGLAFAAIFEMAGGTAVALLASAAAHLLWNGWLSWLPV